MSTLFPKPFSVSRRVTSIDSYGRATISEATSVSFLGSVQPMIGAQVSREFPGRETHGYVVIYSDTALQIAKEGTNVAGDILTWHGDKWEVVHALVWDNDLIPHYEYAAENRGPV